MVRGISSSEIVFATPLFSFCLKYGVCVCIFKTHYIIKTHSNRPHSTKPSKNPLQRLFQTRGTGQHRSPSDPFGPSGPVTTYWKLRQLLASSRSCCLLLSCPWSTWRRPGRWTCGQRVVSTCFNMIQAIPEMITWIYNNNSNNNNDDDDNDDITYVSTIYYVR